MRGENGVGKDLVASLLHYLGPHPDEPIVKIDCASLPHELLESELFGYDKGAFTGATHQKRGRLELAGNGTLILDEIAALTMPMQAKLLRVIEQKEFERLGGEKTIKVHARILALTNVDLERAVARRSFREDLYSRLSVIPLVVPPLRERAEDIVVLAEWSLKNALAALGARPHPNLHAEVTACAPLLTRYDWPGNVRELRNLTERLALFLAAEPLQALTPSFVQSVAPELSR